MAQCSIELIQAREKRPIEMSSLSRAEMSRAISWLVVGTLGALEGIYGRTQYLGDWICYLNVSRAASALDWKHIFDPMWNPGYPILIALVRGIFPHTAEGEWHAITLLNWFIFLMAYASWRYLIRQAIEFYQPSLTGLRDHPAVLWTTTCAFLGCTLCLDSVSSVSPDLLITTLFIFAAAQVLALLNRPGSIRAIGLGLTLGAGCWVKGAFLSFACVFLLVLLLACCAKRLSWRALGLSGFAYLAIFVPYVAAISICYGQFTLGVSGPLNYAFHVNHMPHWTNWQGGAAAFGAPLHPTRQLISDLPVFEFGAPFRTTYPPFNNLAYWYQGSKNFFSLKLQIIGIGHTLYFLATIVKTHPFVFALALALLIVMLRRDWRISFRATARFFWPLFLPAILGIAIYLAVHIEDRYVSPFCLIFSLLPLLPLLDPALKSKRVLTAVLLVIYTVGAAAELGVTDGLAFRDAIHRNDFHRDPQWKLATALPSYGLRSGDAVALIHDKSLGYRFHWAYISNLRIVAEFGSLPWATDPWDRTRFDPTVTEPADQDYGLLFWKKLTPGRRAQVMNAFRGAGARAVVAQSRPDATPEPGWRKVAGTNAWIYRFGPDTPADSGPR